MLVRGAATAGRHALRHQATTTSSVAASASASASAAATTRLGTKYAFSAAAVRSAAATAVATKKPLVVGLAFTLAAGSAGGLALTEGRAAASAGGEEGDIVSELKSKLAGLFGGDSDAAGGKKKSAAAADDDGSDDAATSASTEGEEESCHSGPGKKVRVPLDPDVVADLPLMDLDYVREHNGLTKTADGRLLVTYDGIVYDVTEFANHHPGGRDLLLTAAGLDLDHFFGNYAVHGQTDKAAQWLAPLAVGRL